MKLQGVFYSEFWKVLVPQACFQEAEVLQSCIALAAAQMGQDKLSLKAYNRAIAELRQREKPQSSYALRLMLITCMVFTSVEFLRGSQAVGKTHLYNGLRLLDALPNQASKTSAGGSVKVVGAPGDVQSVDDCLVEAFTRMRVQVSVVDHGAELVAHRTRCDAQPAGRDIQSFHVPETFIKLGRARQWLDHLLSEALALSSEAEELTTEQARIPNTMRRRQKRIEEALGAWLRAFESSTDVMNAAADAKVYIAFDALRTFHAMAEMIAQASLRGTDEMLYDRYYQRYAYMLHQVWKIWRAAEIPFGHMANVYSFTTDMGFVPPLYFTALKCREPNLRRIAIDLLGNTPHIEGAWDGRTAAAIVRRIMELEEGDVFRAVDGDLFAAGDSSASSSLAAAAAAGAVGGQTPPLSLATQVPAANRVSKVVVHLDPVVRGRARVEACRYVRGAVGGGIGGGGKKGWVRQVTELSVDVTMMAP